MTSPAEAVTATCPRPVRRAVMIQGWHDLAAIHWRYDPAVVQRLLPSGFAVDTFDGCAWVGLIPFRMVRVRVPRLPALGPLSTFPETNVRTYIVDRRGRRGVWFFSLDITRLIPTAAARLTYRLPYCWARMSIDRTGDVVEYRSRRRLPHGPATSHVRVGVGARLTDDRISELDHFLSARWALGSTFLRRPIWAEVDHAPWPLHEAELLSIDESMVSAAGLPIPGDPAIVRWSPGVEVRIGRPGAVPR